MGSGKFKIWKTKNLGFFEKWPPGPPQKGKKPKKGYFWSLGTQMAYQKNFQRFSGWGVEKYVAAHWTAPLTIWHNIFLLNGVCDLLLTSNAMKKKFHQVFMKQEAGKLILPGSRQTDFRLQTPSEIKITILYLSISHMKKLLDVRCNNNIFGKLSR